MFTSFFTQKVRKISFKTKDHSNYQIENIENILGNIIQKIIKMKSNKLE